jgi:hypothetical protein
MSNGDDEAPTDDAADDAAEDSPEGPVAAFEARLDDAESSLEAAETEAELDEVEATLDDIEADLEDADLPEPSAEGEEDGDDDEAEDPRVDLEDRLAGLREDLEAQRGPYAADVEEIVEGEAGTLRDSEWTDDGADEAVAAVATFLESADEHVDIEATAGDDVESAAEALESAAFTIGSAGLDAEEDADTIAALLEDAETLQDDLEAAEVWSDLSVREQLAAEGFYEPVNSENRKDFPPEWSAIKAFARDGEVEPLLLALDKLGDSDFMEEYVFEQLVWLGRDAAPAFEEMHQRSQKRNKPPIRILGNIANDDACETLHEFIEDDGDVALQKVVLRALGEIGSEESTQPVAQRLEAESEAVRSAAARSLGLIGDTRAIDPLSDVLDDGEEADQVRASAAWALRQIGTQGAFDVLADHADDQSYIVQAEAQKAAGV